MMLAILGVLAFLFLVAVALGADGGDDPMGE